MYQIPIQEPDHKLLRWFYNSAKAINTSLVARIVIFFLVYIMVFVSAVMDIVTQATGNASFV